MQNPITERHRELYRILGPNRILRNREQDAFRTEWSRMRDQDKLEARLTRNLILQLFGVKNLSEITNRQYSEEEIRHLENTLNELWCKMYGVEGTKSENKNLVESCIGDADGIIKMIEDGRFGLFRSIQTQISAVNEVMLEKSPIRLMLMLLSDRYCEQAVFEARRKLVLADLALSVRSYLNGEENIIKKFHAFLDEHIFKGKIGQTVNVDVQSTHSPIDYSCLDAKIIHEGERVLSSEFQLFHSLKMRPWEYRGQKKLVQVDQRGKRVIDYVVKLMRKDEKSAGVVDDPLGFKLTFLNKQDILHFLKELQTIFMKQGVVVKFENPYDTVANGVEFRVTNPGSSEKLELIKVHFYYEGHLIELQLHTIRTHLNSKIQDGVGHEEFSLHRLVAAGKWTESVMDLLYPTDIYGNGWKDAWPELIQDIRESNRHRSLLLPPEKSHFNKKEVRYSDHNLAGDVAKILQAMATSDNTVIPDVIIVPGVNELFLASEFSLALGGIQIIIAAQETGEEIRNKTKGKNTLILDDIADKCQNIKQLKAIVPDAKVATLVKRKNAETTGQVDFFAREVESDIRIRFFWERGRVDKLYRPPVHVAVLPYRRENGVLQVLCQVIKKDGSKTSRVKLIGGAKQIADANLTQTAVREIFEEVDGLEDYPLIIVGENGYQYSKKGSIYISGFVKAFGIQIDTEEKLKIRDNEVASLEWFSLEELKKLLYPAEYRPMLDSWAKSML